MRRIARVIVQGTITNPDDYRLTSGNMWLNKFENLQVVHPDFKHSQVSFVIEWKNGKIGRWDHDFELNTNWKFEHVSITYIDTYGNVMLRVEPENFNFNYNIARSGVIKNWKIHKKGFISIMKWSLDNMRT